MSITKEMGRICASTLVATAAIAGPAGAAVGVQSVVGGLDNPVDVTHAGDGSGRLFIVSQRGSVYIWDGSQLLGTPFLDIENRVSFGGEQGLLGVAFHPEYAANGRFYVHYSDRPGGDTVVSEFTVSPNPNRADPSSEVVLFTENQPFSNHNGGQIAFGPDDYLYIALGDGGSGGDPGDRAQDLGEVLGKILRLDVDGNPPYIPPSNPFVGNPAARDEIWAGGVRNPWRMSFDRLHGDLFIADVGQEEIEEIDFQPSWSGGGENYGWRLMEGSECFNPPNNCNDGSLVLPIMEYNHFDGGFQGCAVTGGFRYRGPTYGDLYGDYFFSDSCTGKIWQGRERLDGSWTYDEVLDTSIAVTSFGEDQAGNLYLVGSGSLYRVTGDGGVYCEIDTERDTYAPGEDLNLSLSQGSNNGAGGETVRTRLAVLRRSGPPIVFFDETSLLNPGETETYPTALGTIPASAPTGIYSIGCRMTRADTGAVLFQGLARFRIQ